MLVVLTKQQILSTKQICNGCLMADRAGSPRWHQGKLSCGHLLYSSQTNSAECTPNCAQVYECHMGFHLANIN